MAIEISDRTVRKEFIEKVVELSGQDIYKCFQCGTCGGGCPMSAHMDQVPRRVMRLTQLGQKERVEELNTCWTCASCHTCTVSCPRGIDLARVMEAIRQLILRESNEDFLDPSSLGEKILKEIPQIALVSAFRKLTS